MRERERQSRFIPFVSVIMPCRNEARFIADSLRSIVNSNFSKDKLEVWVVDGMSEDGTRDIAGQFAREYPFVHLVDNPRKITPCALNIGIRHAKGELIAWVSSHNTYAPDYLSQCVKYSQEYGADNVGGGIITEPTDDTLLARAIVLALSHKFGVGSSVFRTGADKPQRVDTVFGGCYKREVFEKVGMFNEQLVRGQDMEFNLRLKKAGLKTLLIPDIKSRYYARSDLPSFLRHNFSNGMWALLPFKYTTVIPVSLRHLIPLAFVGSLLGALVLGLFLPVALAGAVFIAGAYSLANVFFSSQIALRGRDLRLVPLMQFIFFTLHFSYGLGSLSGAVQCLFSFQFWKNIFGADCVA